EAVMVPQPWIPSVLKHWPIDWGKVIWNYVEVFDMVPVFDLTRNTLYITFMSIIGQLFACSMVGYAFARLVWPGRDTLFVVLLATMMLPPQVTFVPLFLIFRSIGWYNTMKPLWVPCFFGFPFFIFLLRQFFKTLPTDLEDAAHIDGCGHFRTFVEIMLPLVKPALGAVAVFQFMTSWNDFLGPLIYINDDRFTTLSMGLFLFKLELGALWGQMMAATTMMTLPAIIVFFCAQKHFVEGITLTGMKE
ncbi:MAG: carbohydrate ABC transporter permease, partial [bacterium]